MQNTKQHLKIEGKKRRVRLKNLNKLKYVQTTENKKSTTVYPDQRTEETQYISNTLTRCWRILVWRS